ncbi:CHY zinc finger protein [Paenibacillus sp.]|uniref:CHY zinc finger protein n=1 Tax=Paenibacillus sp. TaxID=58172 RepID=UPI002D443E6B|nr:CHY zinc finger protein [Paenibacillus sp.]HZG55836.1 CHY zinc finger protein [Paenibacillus sp.]
MRPLVIGAIDAQTRCKHYHGPTDVIAIKFKCCDAYYGCFFCHEEAAGHPPAKWGEADRIAKAVLCGGCGEELAIDAYLNSGYACPSCGTAFNPRCEAHYPLYFDFAGKERV